MNGTKTTNPLLSIITVCYNEPDIEKTCESIVNQTFQNFEWIVIDGGSTDGTLDIIKKYEHRINILVSEKDNGIYNGMNKGINLASGQWINFMNGGDCFYSKDTLKEIFEDKNYDDDILYGSFESITKNKSYIKKLPEKLTKRYFFKNCINHQSTFIKRELFNKYGLYNEKLRIISDWEKWLVFLINGCKFRKISSIIAKYSMEGLSGTNQDLIDTEKESVYNKFYTEKEIIDFKKHVLKNERFKFIKKLFGLH